jgi:6-phosphogluconolactonase (cycloisomerase 2 family)
MASMFNSASAFNQNLRAPSLPNAGWCFNFTSGPNPPTAFSAGSGLSAGNIPLFLAQCPLPLQTQGTIAAGLQPFGITISLDGTSVYVTNYSANTVSIYSRNTSTGALTSQGTIATGTNPLGVTISADGTSVYVANAASSTVLIYSRNTSTGALTSQGTVTTGAGSNPIMIAISADGTSVYVTNQNTNTVSIYRR